MYVDLTLVLHPLLVFEMLGKGPDISESSKISLKTSLYYKKSTCELFIKKSHDYHTDEYHVRDVVLYVADMKQVFPEGNDEVLEEGAVDRPVFAVR